MRIVENKTKALSGLLIESDKVTVLRDSIIVLDRDFFDSCEVGTDYIEMLAVFDLLIYNDVQDDVVNPFRFTLNYPLKIYFNDMEETSNRVTLSINEGTVLIADSFYKNDVNTAYQFFTLLLSGKYNENAKLSYQDLLASFKEVLSNNEIGGHDSIEYEILLQKLCKNAKNLEQDFRLVAKANSTANDFKMINVRNVPRYESAFNAISSENINKGIMKTLIKESETEILSPLERIALSKR